MTATTIRPNVGAGNDVLDLIRRTRLDRGLPETISDDSILGRVARLASKGANQ